MPTKILAITDGKDLATLGWRAIPAEWYFFTNPADLDMGYISMDIYKQGHCLRFQDFPIPPGSTILYAYMKYSAFSHYDGDVVRCYLKAEKSLNPDKFSTWNNYLARPRTDHQVDWSNIPHWVLNRWYNSIDFTPVLQEVIDQAGWTAGNPVVILCDDLDDRSDHLFGCTRHAHSIYEWPEKGPQLRISWLEPGEDPLSPQLGESYTIGGDTLIKFNNPVLAGQTFTPSETHILEYIDLNLRGPLYIPTPVILIYSAGSDHKPYGDYIAREQYIAERHSSFFTTGRVRFKMQAVELYKDSEYVIVAGNYPGFLGTSAYWQYDTANAQYPRGVRISSPDHGVNWTVHPNSDHIFAEFGHPPLPKPEPPPPIKHFAILDLNQTPITNGIKITLPTSVPCHLTCYWTDKKPRKHPTTAIIRGLEVPWHTYFCFVAWHAVEQTEAGDTLIHTFDLYGWEYCQTRWLTFRGEVDNIDSPSVGPIFEKHNAFPSLYEYLNTGDNRHHLVGSYWFCQTFTPSITHTITKVNLKLARNYGYDDRTFTVSIRETDAAGKPTGPDLCQASITGNDIPIYPSMEWKAFDLADSCKLNAGTKYAIVVHSHGSAVRYVFWRGASTNLYPLGSSGRSTDGGNTWTLYDSYPADYDQMFEEWGIP